MPAGPKAPTARVVRPSSAERRRWPALAALTLALLSLVGAAAWLLTRPGDDPVRPRVPEQAAIQMPVRPATAPVNSHVEPVTIPKRPEWAGLQMRRLAGLDFLGRPAAELRVSGKDVLPNSPVTQIAGVSCSCWSPESVATFEVAEVAGRKALKFAAVGGPDSAEVFPRLDPALISPDLTKAYVVRFRYWCEAESLGYAEIVAPVAPATPPLERRFWRIFPTNGEWAQAEFLFDGREGPSRLKVSNQARPAIAVTDFEVFELSGPREAGRLVLKLEPTGEERGREVVGNRPQNPAEFLTGGWVVGVTDPKAAARFQVTETAGQMSLSLENLSGLAGQVWCASTNADASPGRLAWAEFWYRSTCGDAQAVIRLGKKLESSNAINMRPLRATGGKWRRAVLLVPVTEASGLVSMTISNNDPAKGNSLEIRSIRLFLGGPGRLPEFENPPDPGGV